MLLSFTTSTSILILAASDRGLSKVTSFDGLPNQYKRALEPFDPYDSFLTALEQGYHRKPATEYIGEAWNFFDDGSEFRPMGDPKRLRKIITGLRKIHSSLMVYRAIREINDQAVLTADEEQFVNQIESIFHKNQTKLREKLETRIDKNRKRMGLPKYTVESASTRADLSRIIDGRSDPKKTPE